MNLKKAVGILVVLSALVYGAQILIFHDPRNTAFYIFQDMAFMPVTIAIATLVVGEWIGAKEKKERLEKTQMLTSSFFTELGAALMNELMKIATVDEKLHDALLEVNIDSENAVTELQDIVRNAEISVRLTEDSYNAIRQLVLEKQTTLLVIASNPLLLEHEEFTKMLWGIFHLIDEFRLRGDFDKMSEVDVAHLNADLSEVHHQVLVSWVANILYMRKNYPNFFNAAVNKISLKVRKKQA